MSAERWVGKAMTGRTEMGLVRGEGTYVDDVNLPGMVYAGFVRSPYAHASLKGLPQKSLPNGVLDMVTGEELHDICKPVESVESIVHPSLKLQSFPWYAMPSDRARYVGEPVVAVVAETRAVAEQVGVPMAAGGEGWFGDETTVRE